MTDAAVNVITVGGIFALGAMLLVLNQIVHNICNASVTITKTIFSRENIDAIAGIFKKGE